MPAPLKLHRSKTLDWAALIRSMTSALKQDKNPIEAARWLAMRLFSEERVRLGLDLSLGGVIEEEAPQTKNHPNDERS